MIKELTTMVKPHMVNQFLEVIINNEYDKIKQEAMEMLEEIKSNIDVKLHIKRFMDVTLSCCSDLFGTTPEEIRSRNRRSHIIDAKRAYMWIIKSSTGCTHRFISDNLEMHHSSVIHHLNTVEAYLMYNPDFKAKLNAIVTNLKQIGYTEPSEQFVNHVNRAEQRKRRNRDRIAKNRL